MYFKIAGTKRKRFAVFLNTFVIAYLLFYVSQVIHAATIIYTYDSLNRLTAVDYGNGAAITYTYDAAGNRLTLVSTPPPDSTPPTTPVITDEGAYTLVLTQLHALWNANDPETCIAQCQYALGTTPQGSDVVGWTTFFCSNNSFIDAFRAEPPRWCDLLHQR